MRRIDPRLSQALGAALTFLVALVAGAILHLDLPATRRAVARAANAVFEEAFKGRVRIERVEHLGLAGGDGIRVRVLDPSGVQVLDAAGVSARIRPLEALRSLAGGGPIVVAARSVGVQSADVNLDADAAGDLRLASAFRLRTNEATTPAPPSAAPRGVRVEATRIGVDHAWVHGTLPGAPPVDLDASGLAGRARVDAFAVVAELDRLEILARGTPRGLDPHGALGGRLEMPLDREGAIRAEATFEGDVGGMSTTVEAGLDGTHVHAHADAFDARGLYARTLTESAIKGDLSVHAAGGGELGPAGTPHRFEGALRITLGRATVDASATAEIGKVAHVDAKLSARHVDLSDIAASVPRSDIALEGGGSVTFDEHGPSGRASVQTLPSRLGGQALPHVEIAGRFADRSARVRLRAGMTDGAEVADVVLEVAPRSDGREGTSIDGVLEASVPDLHRLPKIGSSVGGDVHVDATAHLTLPEEGIVARATVIAKKLSPPGLEVGELSLVAQASGSLARPGGEVEVQAKSVTRGRIAFASADAHARVERSGERGISLRDASVAAVRGRDAPVRAVARLLRVQPAMVDVEGAEVTGLGEPVRGDLHVDARRGQAHTHARDRLDVRIDAPAIDLAALARLVGQAERVQRGTLTVQGEARSDDGNATGRVHVGLVGLGTKAFPRGDAVLDARVEGREVGVDARADLAGAGTLTLRTDDVTIAGRLTELSSWQRVRGKVSVDGALDLGKVEALLPPDLLPVSELGGGVTLQGRIGRDAEDAPPEVALHAQTSGLAVAARGPAESAVGVKTRSRWRLSNVDLGAEVRSDGPSGLTNIAARATDRHGLIAAIDVKTILPYAELSGEPSALRERILSAPAAVRMIMPPRRLDQLPSVLGVSSMGGVVDADVDVSGTVADPRLRLTAHGREVSSPTLDRTLKIDSALALDYDGREAHLDVEVGSKGKVMLELKTRLEASARAVFLAANHAGPQPPWEGWGRVRLTDFPLELVPQLFDRHVRGRVSGEVALDDLHRDAHGSGRLDFEHFAVGRTRYDRGTVTVDASKGRLAVAARLDEDPKRYLDAHGSAGLTWGSELVPRLDPNRAEATLVANAFSARVVQPFLPDAVPRLDGRVDADLRASWKTGKTRLEGQVAFSEGSVQIAALGDELRKVRATATFTPDGRVEIRRIVAHGTRGEFHADAVAQLDGLRFVNGAANVDIPQKSALDVGLEGQPVGSVFGEVRLRATQRDAKTTTLDVDVPKLEVELPQVTKTGVQSLESTRRKDIRVGVYRGGGSFVQVPLEKADTEAPEDAAAEEASRVEVDVKLGNVTLVRGNTARVIVTGNPKVSVVAGAGARGRAQAPRVTGQVNAVSGWVEVQGKRFEIEKALVTFNGESPPNPLVVATAEWDAPDGTHVFVDFAGPAKTGKAAMRSEPSRSKDELLALILFGSSDAASPGPGASAGAGGGGGGGGTEATSAAFGIGGGIAAQGLTQALDDLAGIRATARIDTTIANNPKPELEVQISPKVTIGFAHVIGTPPITQPDSNFGKFQWRFHSNWSLQTTVGDRGTGLLDAIWQKHY